MFLSITPSLNVNISDDYHLYQRVDEHGRVIENDAILIPRSEAARFRINIARIKRANANNEGGEKSQRFGPKAMEDAENSGSNKKASRAVKTDAENKAAKTVQKKAREPAETQERLTSTAAAKTFDKFTRTENQADESVHITSEEIFEAINGVNSNDDDRTATLCDCDRTDRIESNYVMSTCTSELTHSFLNNSCDAFNEAVEDVNSNNDDRTATPCDSDRVDKVESNYAVSTCTSDLNDSDFWDAYNAVECYEHVNASANSSTIDVHNHPDVQPASNVNRAMQPVVNHFGYGTTVLQSHLSIPEINVSKTSSSNRVTCKKVSRSQISTGNSNGNKVKMPRSHNRKW